MPLQTYICRFVQQHDEFRLPELIAICEMEGIEIRYDMSTYRKMNPFLLIELPNDESAKKILARSIMIKNISKYFAHGRTYEEVIGKTKGLIETQDIFASYKESSFKFETDPYGRRQSMEQQIRNINKFHFMNMNGKVDLINPEITFVLTQDHGTDTEGVYSEEIQWIYFGLLIGSSNRSAMDLFDLKKRKYIGITSMDAELSLVCANIAKARKGTLIYDPFVGTGSFLFTCSHFGAYTMGSDIDGRQMRGKEDEKDHTSIMTNLDQYNIGGRVLDTLVFDITTHPLRDNIQFDAIVTDPPYGVRAGAKKVASSAEPLKNRLPEERGIVYPATVPYEIVDVFADLLAFSAQRLVMGGRLLYWLPIVHDDESPIERIPMHPSLRLVSNSEQVFAGWSRRLICMEKVAEPSYATVVQDDIEKYIIPRLEQNISISKLAAERVANEASLESPGYHDIRRRYFEVKKEIRAEKMKLRKKRRPVTSVGDTADAPEN